MKVTMRAEPSPWGGWDATALTTEGQLVMLTHHWLEAEDEVSALVEAIYSALQYAEHWQEAQVDFIHASGKLQAWVKGITLPIPKGTRARFFLMQKDKVSSVIDEALA